MKTKTLLSVLAFGLFLSAFSQKATMELTFTAENNGQYVPLDSILIENIMQGGDTTLYAPDTVLLFEYTLSVDEMDFSENSFHISQNYPNPFKGKTEVNLCLPEKDDIKIIIRDILGRELANYENTLNRGNHSFTFYSGYAKYYLLTVIGKQTSQTIKMLNANCKTTYGGKCTIVYNKYEEKVIIFKSQQAINNFGFSLGDELKYTSYTDVEETEINDSPEGSQTYTIQFDGWTPCLGMSTVTDIDGNIYNTVQIGDQCWMKENLKTTTYQDGTSISNIEDTNTWSNLTTGAFVWYDNEISWKDLYGGLYNWYAAVDANGLCPTGWHVPTNAEWTALTDFIGGAGTPHGNELKTCRQVNSPLGEGCNTNEHPRWNEDNIYNGTDNYGFSGLPGCDRNRNGPFGIIGTYSRWWSSTNHSSIFAWSRGLTLSYGSVGVGYYYKRSGFSVRCLRDF